MFVMIYANECTTYTSAGSGAKNIVLYCSRFDFIGEHLLSKCKYNINAETINCVRIRD